MQKTILVVEDDGSFRTALRKILEKENYRILEAANGKEGQKLNAGEKVDLIILDYYLGDMTGADFLKTLPGRVSSPVIVLSANTNEALDQEVRGLGAKVSLSKPISRPALLEAVKRTIHLN